MNKSAVIEELCSLLDDVLIHPEVVNEIRQLILGTGNEKQFLRQLAKQLELLKELRGDVIKLPQFEKLKAYHGLYSMHLESKEYNIRVLYSYSKQQDIILHCFYERAGKEISSYELHAPIAMRRKAEMEE